MEQKCSGIRIVTVVDSNRRQSMTYDHPGAVKTRAMNPVCATLLAFPIACFSLALLTDVAYWRTVNLLWLHFSEWLLLAGLLFGVLALLACMFNYFVRGVRPAWLAIAGGVLVLLLATLNSFIHTADGWTAVVPYGLVVSVLTVFAMILTGWLGSRGARHV